MDRNRLRLMRRLLAGLRGEGPSGAAAGLGVAGLRATRLLALLLRQQPPPPPPLSPLLTRALLSRFNLLRHLPVPVGMRPCCPSATLLLLLLLLLLSLLLSL